MKDANGVEINLGDIVVKAHSGSVVRLEMGIVIDFTVSQVVIKGTYCTHNCQTQTIMVVNPSITTEFKTLNESNIIQPKDSKRAKVNKKPKGRWFVFANEDKTKILAVEVEKANKENYWKASHTAKEMLEVGTSYGKLKKAVKWPYVKKYVDMTAEEKKASRTFMNRGKKAVTERVKFGWSNGSYDKRTTLNIADSKLPDVLRAGVPVDFTEELQGQIEATYK